MNDYNPSEYPQGVPSPYVPRVHPYPSYAQGPDYTRPVFDMPFVPRPFNVMEGLGQESPPQLPTTPDVGAGYQFGANFRSDEDQWRRCLADLRLTQGPGRVLLDESGIPVGPESYADAYMCAAYYRGQKSGYWYGIAVGAVTAISLGALWRRIRKP